MPERTLERTYHLLGVPFRPGSLYPGSENDAQPYRDAHILRRFEAAGCRVVDEGDVPIPSYLPHHHILPIKNWPGSRIAPYLRQDGHIPLLIGADCSVVVGTAQALMRVYGEAVHIIYVDGDIDDVAPQPDRCLSAAAMALWLTTQASPFRAGPTLKPSQVIVMGWADDLGSPPLGLQSSSLADVRRLGPGETARRALHAIPPSAPILLHFDIDVLNKQEMPAAYVPHADGLSLAETQELLSTIGADSRLRIIEVAEYASLRDLDRSAVAKIIDILATGLGRSGR